MDLILLCEVRLAQYQGAGFVWRASWQLLFVRPFSLPQQDGTARLVIYLDNLVRFQDSQALQFYSLLLFHLQFLDLFQSRHFRVHVRPQVLK